MGAMRVVEIMKEKGLDDETVALAGAKAFQQLAQHGNAQMQVMAFSFSSYFNFHQPRNYMRSDSFRQTSRKR